MVTVSDGTLSATADFVWTISSTNRAPVAASATFTTPKNRTLTANLTATDPDGDTFTYVLVVQGRKGTATINAQTGAFAYSPVGNPNGTDTFTFKANDGTADSNVATVTIKFTAATANTPPVASTGTISINEDVSGTGNLVASDAEGTALTYRIGTNGTKGSATANSSTGSFTYVPLTNANGTDTFTFIANDGTSDSNVAVVTVTIAAVNDAPVASNDTATTAVNTSVTIAVLTNDSDPDQETPTVASVSGATNGTIGFTDTQIVYTPNSGFVGSDTFTYVVKDAAGALSTQATVTVTITGANARPIAQGQSIATTEDSAHPIVLTGTDAEGSALTFTIVAAPTHGTLTGTGANVIYTPASNYNGSDTFAFVVNDGVGDSAPATVAITVNAVNDLPVASDLAVVTTKGQTVTGTLLATDVDGGALTFEVVMQPKKGTVSVDPSGGFTYTPNPTAKGNDTFTFRASDGSLVSNSAKVTVTIR